MKQLFCLSLVLVGLLISPVSLAEDETPAIKEWLVPWEASRPRDPYMDEQGRVWFCGQGGNYIAYLEPGTGKFKRYTLRSGTYPHNLIVDSKGFVWYAGNRNAHIGRLNPQTGDIEEYPMPNPQAADPHTLVFNSLGNIWFTVQGGNFIGQLNVTSGVVDLSAVPTKHARPYGIKVDQDDHPWVVLFGTNKLLTLREDPAKILQEIELPRQDARPRRIEITDDGEIWYVDYREGMLGRYTPTTNKFKEWPLPGGESARPYGTARDHLDRLWIAESGSSPNRLVGFDPKTEQFFASYDVPSGGGTIRHMYFHTQSREVWFGTDTNYIGRLSVP